MESELHFEWPNSGFKRDEPARTSRPLARRASDRAPKPVAVPDGDAAPHALDDPRATIARLEADRRAARLRIDELEAANVLLETRVAAQRHRLLLLERQLEDAQIEPAREPQRASWIERLLGGRSSVSAV